MSQISARHKNKGITEKEAPKKGERVYVLCCVFAASTFQVDRSPLKAPVLENTVHHRKTKKSNDHYT